MATTAPKFVPSFDPQPMSRIVGFACLAGFLVDLLLIALPSAPSNPEWRVNFLQQMSDRSIILLFGAALVIYGNLENRRWRKQLGMGTLAIGIAFLLSCVLTISDGLRLSSLAEQNITDQASQVQTQIQNAKEDPELAPNVTPEQLKQAAQLIDTRVVSLKQTARSSIRKTMIAIVANLVVIGVALISLGYYSMRPRRS
ncbi:MAG: HpsJ family protein [Elainella sp. Prado103]|jgi:hypothetical protein|nr:HpsJ family protein [Elainella sp. Prado103]